MGDFRAVTVHRLHCKWCLTDGLRLCSCGWPATLHLSPAMQPEALSSARITALPNRNVNRASRWLTHSDSSPFLHTSLQLETLNMDPAFLNRNVNEGFSGGEKKRNEILQLACLEADMAILDEIDSGQQLLLAVCCPVCATPVLLFVVQRSRRAGGTTWPSLHDIGSGWCGRQPG